MCSPLQNKSTAEEETFAEQNNAETAAAEIAASESDSDEEETACNPEVDDPAIEAQIDILREQNIGNTLYSKRFVLTQLMRLVKKEYELDEDFEENLCLLWDMTEEKDVVLFMAENNALEVFCEVVDAAEDFRLLEIVLGIVGNMCVEKDVLIKHRNELSDFLNMFTCPDASTLIQLMRVFTTIFSVDEINYSWLEMIAVCDGFVDNLSYILTNSTNKILLAKTLSLINCMLARFTTSELPPEKDEGLTIADIFVKSEFVQSIFVAYEYLDINFSAEDDEFANASESGYDDIDVIRSFFIIHCTLMQYREVSREVYKEFMPILVKEINLNMQGFQHTSLLLLMPAHFVEDLLLSAFEIHIFNINFGYHCDREGFKLFLEIWQSLHFSIVAELSDLYADNEEKRIVFESLDETIAKCMGEMLDKCSEEELPEFLRQQDRQSLIKLSTFYKEGQPNDCKRAEIITTILANDENKIAA